MHFSFQKFFTHKLLSAIILYIINKENKYNHTNNCTADLLKGRVSLLSVQEIAFAFYFKLSNRFFVFYATWYFVPFLP